MREDRLINYFTELLNCDTARVNHIFEKKFLIIGYNRHTENDQVIYWTDESGKRVDFPYNQEHIVASGLTYRELIQSAKNYYRLTKMTAEEFLKSGHF